MSTLIGIIVYGAFAVGYVTMLVLTERSAARYVANGCTAQRERTMLLLTTADTAPASAPARTPAPACTATR